MNNENKVFKAFIEIVIMDPELNNNISAAEIEWNLALFIQGNQLSPELFDKWRFKAVNLSLAFKEKILN